MKTLEVEELQKRLSEILRALKEKGETLEVTEHGEVVAHVVPVSEEKKSREQEIKAFWADIDELATQIGAQWKGNMSAVDAVRDVRRDL